jgi:hypothetical protein
MALSPAEMHDKIIENLKVKTGKSFTQWLSVINKLPENLSEKQRVKLLKTDHGLGHFTAIAILKNPRSGNPHR